MGRQTRTLPKREGRSFLSAENQGTPNAISTKETIPNWGLSVIGTSADTYVMDPPEAGVIKYLYRTTGASSGAVVKLSVVSSGDSITVGQTGTEIAFHTTDHALVGLIGISSVKWAVLHATTGATAVNSTGIVFQAS